MTYNRIKKWSFHDVFTFIQGSQATERRIEGKESVNVIRFWLMSIGITNYSINTKECFKFRNSWQWM